MKGKLNGLDLFSGIGGNTIALAPWVRTIAYCERDRYAAGVLLSRMATGDIAPAPIWDDITTLRGPMLPPIDVIIAGFPCQDLSLAGRGLGLEGERSGLFFEIVRLAKEIEPPFLFLENVPGIRTRGLATVCRELSSLGYDLRWDTLSAAAVGAPHLRNRWFLAASHPDRIAVWERAERMPWGWQGTLFGEGEAEPRNNGGEELMAYASGRRCRESKIGEVEQQRRAEIIGGGSAMAHAYGERGAQGRPGAAVRKRRSHSIGGSVCERSGRWPTEPAIRRVAHGIPRRVDRIRCLGNAVVPKQAREAFTRLFGIEE